MQIGASHQAIVRAMFSQLIDYAGLFPPAQLTMAQAAAEYIALRQSPQAWMLGRFIVPCSRTGELLTLLGAGESVAISVILDEGPHGLERIAQLRQSEPRLRVEALEIVLQPDRIETFVQAVEAAGATDLPCFVEFARGADWEENVPRVMAALALAHLGAKMRCGGANAAAFPSPEQLAAFLFHACRCKVPFKATAGLHHPVRHFDAASGAYMTGFLNILAAAAVARAGSAKEYLIAALACEDAAAFQFDDGGFRFGASTFGVAEIETMRRESFSSYGSCSFSEPVEDLRELRLL
jgi:hypothetical protein